MWAKYERMYEEHEAVQKEIEAIVRAKRANEPMVQPIGESPRWDSRIRLTFGIM